MNKLYDLVATIGEYQSGGQKKKRYKNVGAVFEKDGNMFQMIDAFVNFAAFPRKEGSESVLISMYAPKDKQSAPTEHEKAKANAYQPEQTDDIPFD